MRVWLLKSKRGGRTCGHLHVRESGARRCLDTQPEPSGWSVVSTYLSDTEGARLKPNWSMLLANIGIMSIGLGMAAFGAVALVWGLRTDDGLAIGTGIFGVLTGLLLSVLWGKSLVDDYRDPSPYGGGWDWF